MELSEDKECQYADPYTDHGAADDVTDEVNARQNSGHADRSRERQHDDTDLYVDIQKRHRDDEGANRMSRGKTVSLGCFTDGGIIAVDLIGSLCVDDRPEHRYEDQRTKRHEHESEEVLAVKSLVHSERDQLNGVEDIHDQRQNVMERLNGITARSGL